jgi:TrmH family RNA methyltransferase
MQGAGSKSMNALLISAENAEFQVIQALKQNRAKRSKLGEVFIEGIECIKQAVSADVEITRIITKDLPGLSDWGKDLIRRYDRVKIIEMSNDLYDSLCDRANPSELLMTAKVPDHTLQDADEVKHFVIAFDRPSDFGNLGSIIRSANAFNADAVFIIGHGVDVYEPKVIRSSLGSVFFSKIIHIDSMETLEEYIARQKAKNNLTVIGTDSTGTVSLGGEAITQPAMLVIGNEAKGMSVKLKTLCDRIVKIPMSGNVNSLNAACAASIVMWEVYKNAPLL